MQVTIYSFDEMEKATKLNGSQLTKFLKNKGIKSNYKRAEDNMLFFEKAQITEAKKLTKEHRESVDIKEANDRDLFTLNQMYRLVRNNGFDVPITFFKRWVRQRGIDSDDVISVNRSGVYKKEKLKPMIEAVAYGLTHRRNAPIVKIESDQYEFLKEYVASKDEFAKAFELDPKSVDKVWNSVKPRPQFIYKNCPYYQAEKLLKIKETYFDNQSNKTKDENVVATKFFE